MLVSETTVTIEKHELPQSGAYALRFTAAPAPEGEKETLPTVFVLHGLGSRKERHLDVCLRLARAGFVACAVDAALHGERATNATRHLGDTASPEFLPTFAHVIMQTVEDVAHFASEWGLQTYGLIGHSMGGFIALHTALADPRAHAVVVVGGALDVSLAGENAVPEADPAHRAAEFLGRPVLFLHGTDDETVPIAGARRLHAALQPHYEGASAPLLSLVELVGVGHEWTEVIADEAVAWMTTHLKAENS